MKMLQLNKLKHIGIILFLIGLLSFTNSCINLKNSHLGNTGIEIHFGRSGGFTNIPMEYKMYENGVIVKIQNDISNKINVITRENIKSIQDLLIDSDFEHLQINQTGNITYFISVKSAKYENTVKWNDLMIDDKLKELYKMLLATTKP